MRDRKGYVELPANLKKEPDTLEYTKQMKNIQGHIDATSKKDKLIPNNNSKIMTIN